MAAWRSLRIDRTVTCINARSCSWTQAACMLANLGRRSRESSWLPVPPTQCIGGARGLLASMQRRRSRKRGRSHVVVQTTGHGPVAPDLTRAAGINDEHVRRTVQPTDTSKLAFPCVLDQAPGLHTSWPGSCTAAPAGHRSGSSPPSGPSRMSPAPVSPQRPRPARRRHPCHDARLTRPDFGLCSRLCGRIERVRGELQLQLDSRAQMYRHTPPASSTAPGARPSGLRNTYTHWHTRFAQQLQLISPRKSRPRTRTPPSASRWRVLEDQADDGKARELRWKPLSWLGTLRPTTADDAWDPGIWQTFFFTTLGLEVLTVLSSLPRHHNLPCC